MTKETYNIKRAKKELERIKHELSIGKDYNKCEEEANEYLAILNAHGRELAKKFGVKHRDLKFASIMR